MVLETMSNNGSACAPGGGGWQVAALPSSPISICLASAWCKAHQQKPAASFVVFRTDVAASKRFVLARHCIGRKLLPSHGAACQQPHHTVDHKRGEEGCAARGNSRTDRGR